MNLMNSTILKPVASPARAASPPRALLLQHHLQQVGHEVAQRAALLVGPLQQALMQLPLDGDRNAARFTAQNRDAARGRGSLQWA